MRRNERDPDNRDVYLYATNSLVPMSIYFPAALSKRRATMELETSHKPDTEATAFRDALQKLQRWDAKNAGHQSEKRSGERYFYESQSIVIFIPLDEHSDLAGAECSPENSISFPACARNLSRSGLSFIVPRELLPRVTGENFSPLCLEKLLTVERKIHVAMATKTGAPLWVQCKVVRFRPIHDGLFECGLQFLAKNEAASV